MCALKCVIVGQRFICVKVRDGGATVYALKCVIVGKGVKRLPNITFMVKINLFVCEPIHMIK